MNSVGRILTSTLKSTFFVDLELNFPFEEGGGGFGGLFGPKVKSEYLRRAIKCALFERKPDDSGHKCKRNSNSDRESAKRIKDNFSVTEIQAFQNRTASDDLKRRFVAYFDIGSKSSSDTVSCSRLFTFSS